jgi:hypothetical protein
MEDWGVFEEHFSPWEILDSFETVIPIRGEER